MFWFCVGAAGGRTLRILLCLELLCLALLVRPLSADEVAESERATFEGESRVLLVQVPVHVTDRDGEPIRGLRADDFRLWVNSGDGDQEQEIARLEVIDQARVTTDHRPRDGEIAADDLPAAARRKLLLLFDLSFARPASVVKARSAALDFVLHELAPGDLAAVATVSVEQGARLLVTFTADRAQLARAIDTLGQPGLTGPAAGDPLRFVLERPAPGAGNDRSARGQFDRLLEEQLDLFRSQRRRVEQSFERGRIANWTRSLAALAGSLATLQGDQHVVVFSEGFDPSLVFGREPSPTTDAAELRRQQSSRWTADPDETFGSSALQSDVADMARVFRRAGARLHAVDVGGLRTTTRADEDTANDGAPRGGRDSLFFVADATGGELLRDANDLSGGLRRLLHRSSVTYLLSFYPRDLRDDVGEAGENDSAYRKLRVEVEGLPRGARVFHREGYLAPRPFADLPPLERALLTSESLTAPEPRRDLDVALLTTTFRAGESASYVPLILEIGADSLLSPRRPGSREELRLEVYVYAGDREGEIRDFVTQQLRVTRDALQNRRGLQFYAHLRLPPGPHRLRLLVRDSDDGRTAVLTRPIDVPRWADPHLLSPFAVQDDPDAWLRVRHEPQPSRAQEPLDEEQVVYPFLLGDEPYVPRVRPAVRTGKTMRVAVVGYGLDAGPPGAGPGDWIDGLNVTVLGDDGVAHPDGTLRDLELLPARVEGQTQLVGRLDPESLRPGNYVLELTTPDGASASMEFRVEP